VTVLLATRRDIDLDAVHRVAWQGEGVEIAPEALARIGECRSSFLALLEAEPELGRDGLGREQRRREVALLDAVAADERDARDAHRGSRVQHLAQDLRARQREHEVDRRTGRRLAIERDAEHHLARVRAQHLTRPQPSAERADAQPLSGGGAQHLGDVGRTAA
jgi:hypothetical protein